MAVTERSRSAVVIVFAPLAPCFGQNDTIYYLRNSAIIECYMQYHDFHIEGYAVSSYGREIILHLIWDYPNQAKIHSDIRFSEIAAYHFVHTGGAILTDIDEIPLDDLLEKTRDQLTEWERKYGGYIHWNDNRLEYQEVLKKEGYKGWQLESAIGFEGFVIAKSISGAIR